MTFDKLYEVIRTVLGDEQIHGIWYYENAKLDSAIRSVFLLGRNPSGYHMTGNPGSAITPDPPSGDPYALICYEASKLLIGGEPGELSMHTRAVSMRDAGHRKRDLLIELQQQIYLIRDGGSVFTTFQSLSDFLGSFRSDGPQFPLLSGEVNIVTSGPDITI